MHLYMKIFYISQEEIVFALTSNVKQSYVIFNMFLYTSSWFIKRKNEIN